MIEFKARGNGLLEARVLLSLNRWKYPVKIVMKSIS